MDNDLGILIRYKNKGDTTYHLKSCISKDNFNKYYEKIDMNEIYTDNLIPCTCVLKKINFVE